MPLQYVEDNGGQRVSLGSPSALLPLDAPLFLFAVSDDVEIPCYSGVEGDGRSCYAVTQTTVDVVTPPLPPRGGRDLSFVARDANGALVATFSNHGVYVVNRYHRERVFGFRSLFPPRLATGPRSLLVTDPLDPFQGNEGSSIGWSAAGTADVIVAASGAPSYFAVADGDGEAIQDVEAAGAASYLGMEASGDAEILVVLYAYGAPVFDGWEATGAAATIVDASGSPSFSFTATGATELDTLTIASDGQGTFGWTSGGVAIVVQALSPLSAWPVGSVFISTLATDPSILLGGGTWVAIGAGRVLVGYAAGDPDFGTLGAVGGAKTSAISAHTGTAVASHTPHTHSVTSSIAIGNHLGHSHGTSVSTTVSIDDHPAHTHSVTSSVSVASHPDHYHYTTVGQHGSHTHTYTDVVAHRHDVTIASGQGSHVHNERTFVTASGGADSGFTRNNVMSGGLGGSTTATTATATLPSMGGSAVSGLGVDMVSTGTTNGPSAALTHATTLSTAAKTLAGADLTLSHSVTNNTVSTGNSIALAHFASASTSVSITTSADLVHSITNYAVTSGSESATLSHSVTQPSAHANVSVLQPHVVVNMWTRTA